MESAMLNRIARGCVMGLIALSPLWIGCAGSAPTAQEMFNADLSNAIFPEGVWYYDDDGYLTATEDECIWTEEEYENFVVDLEFRNGSGTNSGVIVYCTDVNNWIPNSVEVQIADDYHEQWANSPKTWQCGAIFGRLAPTKRTVLPPGEWNQMTVKCEGQIIEVILNGELITSLDMSLWTSATHNPDGSEIPSWLNRPLAEMATRGRIGLQGKHAGAPVWFRNITIRPLQ